MMILMLNVDGFVWGSGKFPAISEGLEKAVAGAASTDEVVAVVALESLDQVWCAHGGRAGGLHVYDASSHAYLASAPGGGWTDANALTCATVVEIGDAAPGLPPLPSGGFGGAPAPAMKMTPPSIGGAAMAPREPAPAPAPAVDAPPQCLECSKTLARREVTEALIMRNSCDRCGVADLPPGTSLHGCTSCVFDICESCFNQVSKRACWRVLPVC